MKLSYEPGNLKLPFSDSNQIFRFRSSSDHIWKETSSIIASDEDIIFVCYANILQIV